MTNCKGLIVKITHMLKKSWFRIIISHLDSGVLKMWVINDDNNTIKRRNKTNLTI